MQPNAPFVILSAERSELSTMENARRGAELHEALFLLDFDPVSVRGVWKGVSERSALVEIDADRYTQLHVATLSELASRFQQDAILYVQWSGRATLISNAADNSTDVDVGEWREISADDAAARDGFTQIGEKFYAAI